MLWEETWRMWDRQWVHRTSLNWGNHFSVATAWYFGKNLKKKIGWPELYVVSTSLYDKKHFLYSCQRRCIDDKKLECVYKQNRKNFWHSQMMNRFLGIAKWMTSVWRFVWLCGELSPLIKKRLLISAEGVCHYTKIFFSKLCIVLAFSLFYSRGGLVSWSAVTYFMRASSVMLWMPCSPTTKRGHPIKRFVQQFDWIFLRNWLCQNSLKII